MSKLKIGDRVELINDEEYIGARKGDKGTVSYVFGSVANIIWDINRKNGSISTYTYRLKLITMEDKEITTKVSRVLEAHAKGCSTVKQTLEILHPECFEKKKTGFKIPEISVIDSDGVLVFENRNDSDGTSDKKLYVGSGYKVVLEMHGSVISFVKS